MICVDVLYVELNCLRLQNISAWSLTILHDWRCTSCT